MLLNEKHEFSAGWRAAQKGGPAAYLQNVTVFEKQVVSANATAVKRSVCQAIATDFLASGNVWGLI